MERNRAQGVIFLFDILLKGGIVNKQDVAEKLGVSTKSISRYISDLNSYFTNEGIQRRVKYSRQKRGYVLETTEENIFTKKEILAISKVLLESRGFNKKEINIIIEKLLNNCVHKDKSYIRQVIGNELNNYVPPKHNEDLIDKLWNLSEAIVKQKKIKIEYTKIIDKGKISFDSIERILIPQGLLFSEYYFYLIAFIDGKNYEYPGIYRLDRIKSYHVLEEGFRINYRDRFKEGEFRNHIQFMQSGKLQTIKFKFKGKSIEAVLDRLPTAEIISENNGEYLIKAKVFGKGIKMWLLSQGEAIEVIEPREFREDMKMTICNMLYAYNNENNFN